MGRASKDKRDMYYRKAKEEGYRARSAYKLLQLHEEFNILQRENILTGVVDLCAAPGSWSQVLATHLCTPANTSISNTTTNANSRNNDNNDNNNINNDDNDKLSSSIEEEAVQLSPRIVAVDLQEMMPIDGVCLLQGDITSEATAREIIRLLNYGTAAVANEEEKEQHSPGEHDAATGHEGSGCTTNNTNNGTNENRKSRSRKADLVVCDGAPDVTGMHELDEYLQHHLLLAALNITTFVLRRGGTFVTKIFRGPNTPFLVAKSEVFFRYVVIAKPKSSRNASMEAFMVCQDYQPPGGYFPSFEHPLTTITQCFTPDAPLPPSLPQRERYGDKDEEEEGVKAKDKIHIQTVVVPFLACGDLSGYDADMCYDRDGNVPVLPPVHPPQQAPYLVQATPVAVVGPANTIVADRDCGNNAVEDGTKRRRVG